MQKLSTKIFIGASILFGIIGVLMVLTSTEPDRAETIFQMILSKLIIVTVFIILTSFALAIAGKYLQK